MRRLGFFVFFFILFTPGAEALRGKAYLQTINNHFKKNDFSVDLKFSKPIARKDVSVEFINRTVQVNFSNAAFKRVKKSYPALFKKVKNVYVYQFQRDLMRVRVNLINSAKASEYKGFVDVNVSGRAVKIFLKNPKAVPKAVAKVAPVKKEKIAPKQKEAKTTPSPRHVSSVDSGSISKPSSSNSWFFFSIGFVLATLLFLFRGKRRRFSPGKENFKVLDECDLDKDKKMMILSYKDRKFIVGVTPKEIQVLKEEDFDSTNQEEDFDSTNQEEDFDSTNQEEPTPEPQEEISEDVSEEATQTPEADEVRTNPILKNFDKVSQLKMKKSFNDYKNEYAENIRKSISLRVRNDD